jgi:hypothetical protein
MDAMPWLSGVLKGPEESGEKESGGHVEWLDI